MTQDKKGGGIKRSIVRGITNPRSFNAGLRAAAKAQLPLTWGGKFTRLPVPGIKTGWRRLPAVTGNPLRDRREQVESIRPRTVPGSAAEGVSVALFPGCMTDWLYPGYGTGRYRSYPRLRGERDISRRTVLLRPAGDERG